MSWTSRDLARDSITSDFVLEGGHWLLFWGFKQKSRIAFSFSSFKKIQFFELNSLNNPIAEPVGEWIYWRKSPSCILIGNHELVKQDESRSTAGVTECFHLSYFLSSSLHFWFPPHGPTGFPNCWLAAWPSQLPPRRRRSRGEKNICIWIPPRRHNNNNNQKNNSN